MSPAVPESSHAWSLKKLSYTVLIAASAVNLTANLAADVMGLEKLSDLPSLRLLVMVSKLLLVPAFAGILFLGTRGAALRRQGAFYLALLFCWGGDLALLLEQDLYFYLGVGSFGLAHVFFIRSYLTVQGWGRPWQWKTTYVLPFIVYGYTLYCVIHHQLTSHVVALALAGYTVVLLSNGVSAFLHMGAKDSASSASLLVGVVLFVQSDSIIAVTQFVNTLPLERFAIMATYILGLSLMIRSRLLDARECALPRLQSQPLHIAAA